jgi:hypothetical protein
MRAMLHDMAAVIAGEPGAGPQVEGEADYHFIADLFYIAADPAKVVP